MPPETDCAWRDAERTDSAVVSRLLEMFGGTLLGAVAYGSWARNDLAASSDLDVLAVLDDRQILRRDLYRAWDALAPLRWDGHLVEPHFVHLPPADGAVTGSWAEAAVEGIVLYERGFEVSRRLVDLRRRIADGVLRRRYTHGQPYWVEAA